MLKLLSELVLWPLNFFGCCGVNSQPFGSVLPFPDRSLDAPVRVNGHVRITGRGPYARLRYALEIFMVVGPILVSVVQLS